MAEAERIWAGREPWRGGQMRCGLKRHERAGKARKARIMLMGTDTAFCRESEYREGRKGGKWI